jgi:hypothetical protein
MSCLTLGAFEKRLTVILQEHQQEHHPASSCWLIPLLTEIILILLHVDTLPQFGAFAAQFHDVPDRARRNLVLIGNGGCDVLDQPPLFRWRKRANMLLVQFV